MDDAAKVQEESVQCDLCKERTIKANCKLCSVKLCKECVGEHISDETTPHDIVTVDQKKSPLMYPPCPKHSGETCDKDCIDCNCPVCPRCVDSEEHAHHAFRSILELVDVKKENIANEMECLQKMTTSYENETAEIEKRISNLEKGYRKINVAVDKQRKVWHEEVDCMVDKLKSDIKKMKNKQRTVLKTHLQSITKLIDDLNSAIEEIKEVLNSGDVSKSLDYEGKLAEFKKLPPTLKSTFPIFTPLKVQRRELRKLFCSLTPPSITAVESTHAPKCSKPPSKPLEVLSEQCILEEPKVEGIVETGYDFLRNVTCSREEEFWVSNWNCEMKNIDTKGSLLKSFRTKSGEMACDVAIAKTNELFYTDVKNRTVNKFTDGHIVELIKLQNWKPLNLCITSSGDIMVTMYNDAETQSKVTRYTSSTEKQTIQFDDGGKPIYSANNKIKYITENKNSDICVADWGAGAVVVVSHLGKVRFRYTGHAASSQTRPFKPRGIATDSKHQILTADHHNNCIHVIAPTGSFLRCIDNCRIENPYGISLDKSDKLFVAEFYSGKVKVIQYMK